VYRPDDHGAPPCAPMPMNATPAQIRATGARVLIVGNCGPGEWGEWVHERGPQWDERGSPTNYPDYPACNAVRAQLSYATHFEKAFEDSTWLGVMLDGTGIAGNTPLTLTDTQHMVRCGVNLIGFDQLRPEDPRLAALVWSWAPNEPRSSAGNTCAKQGGDGRLRAGSCNEVHRFACILGSGARYVSARAGKFSDASRACAFSHGKPDMPANGYENQLLRDAKRRAGGSTDIWVRYHAANGVWTTA
jgi:hypothetical protein